MSERRNREGLKLLQFIAGGSYDYTYSTALQNKNNNKTRQVKLRPPNLQIKQSLHKTTSDT